MPCLRLSHSSRRAFSLTEVIVVMGVIGVLMAIVLPTVGAIRERAWEAECQSNLRTIGTFFEMYRQKSDGLLPRLPPLPSGDPFGEQDGLPGEFSGWTEPRSRLWLCPADHEPDSVELGTSYFYIAGAFILFSPLDPFPAQRDTTSFFQGTAGNGIPILWDAKDVHFTGTMLPRNGLFMDGHVSRVGEPFAIPGN